MMKSCARLAGALALGLVAAACATTPGTVPRPFPMPGTSAPRVEAAAIEPAEGSPAPVASRVDTYALVGTALDLRGVPYRDGGDDPSGFDCSGFARYVFSRHGVPLPRAVRDQFAAGRPVQTDDLREGDLLFFTTTAPGASHVGIAIGGDSFVHAPSTTGVVRVERLSHRYWAQRFVGARRLVP